MNLVWLALSVINIRPIQAVRIILVCYFSGSEAGVPEMVFSKPLDIEDNSLVYFEVLEPPTLRYIYKSRPARNFGMLFVSSKWKYNLAKLFYWIALCWNIVSLP